MNSELQYEPKLLDETRWRFELEALTEEYEQMLAFIEQELKKAPEGRLEVHTSKRGTQYTVANSNGIQYLSKADSKRIQTLAQKNYYERALRFLKQNVKRNRYILQIGKERSLTDINKTMLPARRILIAPLTMSVEDFIREWKGVIYESKAFKENDTEHYAKNGIRVRSKSEVTIVDQLLDYDLAFRYEFPVYLRGYGNIHPDFIVLNKRTGQELIWEHFGKMDDFDYANNMVKRVEAYHYNGYYEGKNFIYTLETSRYPFGPRDAKRIIEEYFL